MCLDESFVSMWPNLSFFYCLASFTHRLRALRPLRGREHTLLFSYGLTFGHATHLELPVSVVRGRGSDACFPCNIPVTGTVPEINHPSPRLAVPPSW